MSVVPSAASLDKDWEIDKIHSNTEAIMEATPVTEPLRRPRASPLAINAAAIRQSFCATLDCELDHIILDF
jgi:hypothetical protein